MESHKDLITYLFKYSDSHRIKVDTNWTSSLTLHLIDLIATNKMTDLGFSFMQNFKKYLQFGQGDILKTLYSILKDNNQKQQYEDVKNYDTLKLLNEAERHLDTNNNVKEMLNDYRRDKKEQIQPVSTRTENDRRYTHMLREKNLSNNNMVKVTAKEIKRELKRDASKEKSEFQKKDDQVKANALLSYFKRVTDKEKDSHKNNILNKSPSTSRVNKTPEKLYRDTSKTSNNTDRSKRSTSATRDRDNKYSKIHNKFKPEKERDLSSKKRLTRNLTQANVNQPQRKSPIKIVTKDNRIDIKSKDKSKMKNLIQDLQELDSREDNVYSKKYNKDQSPTPQKSYIKNINVSNNINQVKLPTKENNLDMSEFTLNLQQVDEQLELEEVDKSLLNKARIKKYEMLQKALENDEEIDVDQYQTEVIKDRMMKNEISNNSSSVQSKGGKSYRKDHLVIDTNLDDDDF